MNYGGIGMVIGHELTHGFDDQGSHYDGIGNKRDWWLPETKKNFEGKAQCLADQYRFMLNLAEFVSFIFLHANFAIFF